MRFTSRPDRGQVVGKMPSGLVAKLLTISPVVVLSLLPSSAGAEDCTNRKPLYVPVETARGALGLRGESRSQYLERRFGAWHKDRDNRIRIEVPTHGAPLTVHVAAIPESDVGVELIVESRVPYIGSNDHQVLVTGHRSIGQYDVTANEAAVLSVPRDVFREPGALLVIVATQGMRGARRFTVRSQDVGRIDCAPRVYAEDRFTAIRLNKTPP